MLLIKTIVNSISPLLKEIYGDRKTIATIWLEKDFEEIVDHSFAQNKFNDIIPLLMSKELYEKLGTFDIRKLLKKIAKCAIDQNKVSEVLPLLKKLNQYDLIDLYEDIAKDAIDQNRIKKVLPCLKELSEKIDKNKVIYFLYKEILLYKDIAQDTIDQNRINKVLPCLKELSKNLDQAQMLSLYKDIENQYQKTQNLFFGNKINGVITLLEELLADKKIKDDNPELYTEIIKCAINNDKANDILPLLMIAHERLEDKQIVSLYEELIRTIKNEKDNDIILLLEKSGLENIEDESGNSLYPKITKLLIENDNPDAIKSLLKIAYDKLPAKDIDELHEYIKEYNPDHSIISVGHHVDIVSFIAEYFINKNKAEDIIPFIKETIKIKNFYGIYISVVYI